MSEYKPVTNKEIADMWMSAGMSASYREALEETVRRANALAEVAKELNEACFKGGSATGIKRVIYAWECFADALAAYLGEDSP